MNNRHVWSAHQQLTMFMGRLMDGPQQLLAAQQANQQKCMSQVRGMKVICEVCA